MQNEVKRKSLKQSLWATIPLLLIGAVLAGWGILRLVRASQGYYITGQTG